MPQHANSSTIPAPIGGLNTRDPLDIMAPEDAPRLVNIFPDGNEAVLRNGFSVFQTISAGNNIQTLAEHINAANGNRYLLSCVDDKIYESTSSAGPTDRTGGATITVDQWQTISVKTPAGSTRTLFFNGTDQPLYYEAASNVASADFTGRDPNDNELGPAGGSTQDNDVELIAATSYRNRLYILQDNKTWFWYAGVNAVAGACNYFDVGSLLQQGGYLNNIGTWTVDAGNGIVEHLVLISNSGEGLIYAGSFPESVDWNLVGRFFLPPPIGRRALLNLGANLVLITIDGVIPLTQAILSPLKTGSYTSLSDKIKPTFTEAARTYGDNFGWQGLLYPRGKYALFNIPIVSNGQARQYVMNTQTGAWTEFRGQDAICWSLFDNKPYFGSSDGVVYQADVGTDSSNSDNDAPIEWEIKSAFNYFGSRTNLKHFNMGRPVFQATGDIDLTFDVDTDFSDKTITSVISVTGAGTPWGSPWGSPWSAAIKQNKNWYSVGGLGRCAAVRLAGNYKNVQFKLSAIHVNYVPGGLL